MLPFFPALYPDELLYSALARYHVWSRNAGYKDTVQDLFGSRTACAIADLFNRLQALYDRLPPGSLNLNPVSKTEESNNGGPYSRNFMQKI